MVLLSALEDSTVVGPDDDESKYELRVLPSGSSLSSTQRAKPDIPVAGLHCPRQCKGTDQAAWGWREILYAEGAEEAMMSGFGGSRGRPLQ